MPRCARCGDDRPPEELEPIGAVAFCEACVDGEGDADDQDTATDAGGAADELEASGAAYAGASDQTPAPPGGGCDSPAARGGPTERDNTVTPGTWPYVSPTEARLPIGYVLVREKPRSSGGARRRRDLTSSRQLGVG